MPFRLSKKLHSRYSLALALLLVLAILPFAIMDTFLNEDRDYALNKEMFVLVRELEGYKKQHGTYPQSLSEIRKSDDLCVTMLYPKCRKVHYKVINNQQDFRLAMHSFTMLELWYKKDACFDGQENQEKNQAYELRKTFSTMYYFCAAYPEDNAPIDTASFPIYRKDPIIFNNPDEWPVL